MQQAPTALPRRAWLQGATAVAAALGLPTLAWSQAKPVPLPAERAFQRPSMTHAQLSPDGRLLAMLLADKQHGPRLAVLNLQTLKLNVAASMIDAGLDSFRWVNDTRLVFDIEPNMVGIQLADRGPGLFAVNADGSDFRQLVESDTAWAGGADSGSGFLPWGTHLFYRQSGRTTNQVLVVSAGEISREKTDYLKLQRLNTANGRASEIDAPLHAVDWLFDEQDQLRMVETKQGYQISVHWRDDPKGPFKVVTQFEALEGGDWQPHSIGPDGRVYVLASHQGKRALFTWSPQTGRLSDKPVVWSKDFDVTPQLQWRDGKLIGARYTIDAEITQWFDAGAQALQNTIDSMLPATANRLSLPTRGDSPFVLVEAFADVQPMLIYVYNTVTRKLTRVGGSHPGIDPSQGAQTDFVRYKARDGREIPAYITLPPGGQKKNLPLVVLVHGGPWVRGMVWRWDPEVQFLASRGYAVLQPEFRGSTGFGREHFEAGWKQWGQAMQTDLADGARWAIAQGIANPKRVAIAGASYGGYATLMGLAQEPDLYRCGFQWVGVSDINLIYDVSWSDANNEWKRYGMPRLVGDQRADAAMLKAHSPLEQAARIRQPVLMAYGSWDARVPRVHGEKMRDALKRHNAEVEWVLYPEEGHGWRKPETNIDFWGRVERFLAKHLAE